MEGAATPTTVTSLDDTAQEYVQEEALNSWTPLVDEVAAAAEAIPTAITNSLNDDDDTAQTPLVDGGEVGAVLKLNAADEDVHATMAKTLPRYVLIQSNWNNMYLRFDQRNASIPNALRFTGGYSYGLETRFEVVPATSGTGLIHILSMHNNRYLSHNLLNDMITAAEVEPYEDTRDPRCTLFSIEFLYSNSNRVFRLRHMYMRRYVYLHTPTNVSNFHASLTLTRSTNADVYTFIDWKSVVVLPDVIRIKGDNGNDLRAWADGFMDYQVKADNSSLFDYEVSPSRDGGIRLKSVRFGTYWTDMSDSTWVLLRQASTAVHNTDTVFLPTIAGERVLIRSLRSNMFCNRHTGQRKNHCLATRSTFPDNWSYMEIEEPVLSRRITDIEYRLDAAVIHEANNVTLISDNTYNRTTQTITAELDVRTTVTNTTEWSNSMTWTLGFTVSFSTGIPKIGSGGLAMSTEVSRETKF